MKRIIFTMVPIAGFADDEIIPYFDEPNLILTSDTTLIGKPGDRLTVPVELKNTGSGYATNITATLSSDNSGMAYVEGSSSDTLRDLDTNRSKSLNFKVKVDPDAENKTYSLTLKVVYYNDYGYGIPAQKYTLTETINIRVNVEDKTPAISISRIDIMPASTINAGDNLVVWDY